MVMSVGEGLRSLFGAEIKISRHMILAVDLTAERKPQKFSSQTFYYRVAIVHTAYNLPFFFL